MFVNYNLIFNQRKPFFVKILTNISQCDFYACKNYKKLSKPSFMQRNIHNFTKGKLKFIHNGHMRVPIDNFFTFTICNTSLGSRTLTNTHGSYVSHIHVCVHDPILSLIKVPNLTTQLIFNLLFKHNNVQCMAISTHVCELQPYFQPTKTLLCQDLDKYQSM